MAIRQPPPTIPHAPLGEAAAMDASGMGDALIREGGAVLKSAAAESQTMLTWGHKAMQTNIAAWHAFMASRSPAQTHGARMRKTFWKRALHRPDADV